MCIIAGAVQHVKGTKLFGMPAGDRQLTVYSNEVASLAENLMILPVPYPETVKFEKVYKSIFRDLRSSLRWMTNEPSNYEIGLTRSASASRLPVLNVGSYRVSIVPSVADFSRIDTSVFSLPEELEEMLKREYSGVFGFLCCRLKAGVQSYEPLAYSHRRWVPDMLFFPTKHYHGHVEEVTADWDHEVYTVRTMVDAHRCNGWPAPLNRLQRLPKGFEVDCRESVHCWEKRGDWDNIDLVMRIKF